MTVRHFVFSEKRSDRIRRHLLFWLFYWIFLTLIHSARPKWNIPFCVVYSFGVLIPQIFLTYALISFVLPKYLLKNRYFFSVLWIIFFWVVTASLNYTMLMYVNPLIGKIILSSGYSPEPLGDGRPLLAWLVSFKGTMVAAGGVCSIRLIKHWHLKEKRSLELLKEKTEAQLQLLRAQVHPHFLFNTLNNIYSKAQNESPASAKMIMELSHILRYVLDEGKRELVPLENELQMLTDYINLEKGRYDDKLDTYVSIPTNTEDIYIAPLLLLPFVENSFKHGTSQMIFNPWINLKIELIDTSFTMKLMNGKGNPDGIDGVDKGTGVDNVKKRLELLYKDKYDLQINEDEEVFVVNLALELFKDASESADHSTLGSKIEYAV